MAIVLKQHDALNIINLDSFKAEVESSRLTLNNNRNPFKEISPFCFDPSTEKYY